MRVWRYKGGRYVGGELYMLLYLMLVSCDLIGQFKGHHFLNVTQFYKGYSREVDVEKMLPVQNICALDWNWETNGGITVFLAMS